MKFQGVFLWFKAGAGCPEKPEIFDFIVFRGSSIPGTGNRDWGLGTGVLGPGYRAIDISFQSLSGCQIFLRTSWYPDLMK